MSRLYTSKGSARQQSLFSAPRNTQRRSHPDDTYQERPQKKRKGGAKKGITVPTKKRGKKPAANLTEDESTSSGDDADGEANGDEDDEDDDDDQPASVAPSRALKGPQTGRNKIHRPDDDNVSEASGSMFDIAEIDDFGDYQKAKQSGHDEDQDKEYVNHLFAREDEEDDDEVYQGVEEISDSDVDPVSIELADQRAFEEDINAMNALDDADSTWDLQNHIEGMSAYGFGASDTEGTVQYFPSSQSSDDGNETLQRHVRFEDAFPETRSAFMTLAESPTMTRALLPSALPHASLTGDLAVVADESEDTDSDLTDDCLPDISLRTSKTSQPALKESSPSSASDIAKKTPRLKGPPCGTFIDDGVKSAGILDSSGKMLIITNPHCLGEQFAKRYAASAPQSPSKGFAEVVFDDNTSQVSQDGGAVIPDPMISSLNTTASAASNGQVEGPPYAFYAQASDYNLAMDLQHDEFEDSEYAELSPHEATMNLEDVIRWDSDSDGDSPTSPIAMSVKANANANATPRNSGLAHLTNTNVMSFRRNADPAFAALQSSPLAPHYSQFSTPKLRSKKRKARTDSPYDNAHYKGVTPVQRMPRPVEQEVGDGSPGPSSKRQRLMT